MSDPERTTIAVLGTLAEFHLEPIPYDLPELVNLVAAINPDLLCLDITTEQWQQQDFSDLPPEVGEALVPLAYQTDIVVVPIAGNKLPPRPQATGWRETFIQFLRQRLAALQRKATPDAINQGWRHLLGDLIYSITRWLAGATVRQTYRHHTEELTQAITAVAQRNPGSRVLVVVNVQHCHHIRDRLRKQPDLTVKTYRDL